MCAEKVGERAVGRTRLEWFTAHLISECLHKDVCEQQRQPLITRRRRSILVSIFQRAPHLPQRIKSPMNRTRRGQKCVTFFPCLQVKASVFAVPVKTLHPKHLLTQHLSPGSQERGCMARKPGEVGRRGVARPGAPGSFIPISRPPLRTIALQRREICRSQ